MQSFNQNEDDDLVVGPQKESLHCPITTLLLEKPVTRFLIKKKKIFFKICHPLISPNFYLRDFIF